MGSCCSMFSFLSFCPFYFGHCLSFDLQLLIGHCTVCPSYIFWLAIVLSVLRLTASDWPLYCLSFDLQLLVGHCTVCPSTYSFWLAIVLSVLPTASDWPFYCLSFDLQLLIGHCTVCPSVLMEQGLNTLPKHPNLLRFLWGPCCSIFSFMSIILWTIFPPSL
jgi:hypothetical protein